MSRTIITNWIFAYEEMAGFRRYDLTMITACNELFRQCRIKVFNHHPYPSSSSPNLAASTQTVSCPNPCVEARAQACSDLQSLTFLATNKVRDFSQRTSRKLLRFSLLISWQLSLDMSISITPASSGLFARVLEVERRDFENVAFVCNVPADWHSMS